MHVDRKPAARCLLSDFAPDLRAVRGEAAERRPAALEHHLDADGAERLYDVEQRAHLLGCLDAAAERAIALGREEGGAEEERRRTRSALLERLLQLARDLGLDPGVEHGGDTAGEIRAELQQSLLAEHSRRVVADQRARHHGEVHVRVDQSGQHAGAGHVERQQIRLVRHLADRLDAPVADQDRDLLARRRSGPVQQARVPDQEILGLRGRGEHQQRAQQKPRAAEPSGARRPVRRRGGDSPNPDLQALLRTCGRRRTAAGTGRRCRAGRADGAA